MARAKGKRSTALAETEAEPDVPAVDWLHPLQPTWRLAGFTNPHSKKMTKRNVEAPTEMDAEPEQFVEVKRRARKRREETSDTSDSETRKRTARRKKKPAISSASEEEEEDKDTDVLDNNGLAGAAKHLLELLDKTKSYEDLKSAKKIAVQIYAMALSAEKENAALRQKASSAKKIDERIEAMDATLSSVVKTIKELNKAQKLQPQMTYSEKLKQNTAATLEAAKHAKRHVVTIFPAENSKIADSSETKQTIFSAVAPTKDKLKIVNVRRINNKGVLIETKTEQDLKNVLDNTKLKAAGLTAGLPAKLKPRLLIKNVPATLQEKEITAAVRHQNLEQYPKEKLQDHFKLSFKTGPKDKETVDWVAEVSPEVREKILRESRVYIGWHACYVHDFVAVTRCYKCQAFGHVAKYCKASIETCGHCAESGHPQKSCPNAKKEPQCVNCKRAGKPHNHSSRMKECPAYQIAMKTQISKIDYGC